MSGPPYRALRIILGIFCLFAAAGGLLIIFSGKPLVMRLFLRPPESEVSTLLLFMMKELGGFSLMLSLMLFFAFRDPVRNVAIVDAFIVGLCVLVITPLLSLHAGHPPTLSWLRDLGTLASTIGAGGAALLSAAARGDWRAILEGDASFESCGLRSRILHETLVTENVGVRS